MSLSISPSASDSVLQRVRQEYQPTIPLVLQDLSRLVWEEGPLLLPSGNEIRMQFPHTSGQPLLTLRPGSLSQGGPINVGVLFSGGPAAGGHNVITGLFDALYQCHPESQLFGFVDGTLGLLSAHAKRLTQEVLASYRNQGGFDLLGSGRTKIETEEQFQSALASAKAMGLHGIVIIGGDDSNTNAAMLSEYFKTQGSAICVVGVPKTIDGDLKNTYVATSFGFDTACKTYSEIIGNIAKDALSTKKYTHFIKLMGRSASHVALECALLTQPNLTLLSEEVKEKKRTLAQVTEMIADLVTQRAERGKNFSIILVAEGLIESMPDLALLIQELNACLAQYPDCTSQDLMPCLTAPSQAVFHGLPREIQEELLLHRDSYGNVQLSQIETERLLIKMVQIELTQRQKQGKFSGKFAPISHFLGYEGRSAFPSVFDCNYCYALGHVAALLIAQKKTGYLSAILKLNRPVKEWEAAAVPLTALLHTEVRKGKQQPVIKKAYVDLKGAPFDYFQKERVQWAIDEKYLFPGPIQFSGEASLIAQPPRSICLEAN